MVKPVEPELPVHLSRARAIVKDGITYPISPVVPIVGTLPDGVPDGVLIIFDKKLLIKYSDYRGGDFLGRATIFSFGK